MPLIPATKSGFTLVEVLIITPLVILVIGVFIALAVTVTGESLRLRESNSLAYDVQNALDSMEDDAYKAVSFPRTIDITRYSFTSPQTVYKAGTSSTFIPMTPTSKSLIIKGGATTLNPSDPARKLVYLVPNLPSICSSATLETYAYLPVLYAYFVENGTLWRRTIIGSDNGYVKCGTPWQKPSCNPVDASNSTYSGVCKAEDSQLLENVVQMDVKFYPKAGDSNESNPWNWDEFSTGSYLDPPSTVNITLTVERSIGGEKVNYSASTRVTSINL